MNLVTIWNRTVREFDFNEEHDLGDNLFNMKGDKIKDYYFVYKTEKILFDGFLKLSENVT